MERKDRISSCSLLYFKSGQSSLFTNMAFFFLTAHECQCFKTLYMFQKPQYLSSRTGFSIIPPTRTATFLWWWSLCAPWMLGSRLVVLGEGPDRVVQRTLIRRKTKIPSILTGGSPPADGAIWWNPVAGLRPSRKQRHGSAPLWAHHLQEESEGSGAMWRETGFWDMKYLSPLCSWWKRLSDPGWI